LALPQNNSNLPDTPEARRYNAIRRRLSIADLALSFALLLALLGLGWTYELRDWVYRTSGDRYALALFLYLLLLVLAAKLIGFPLDYYGFRLEHEYRLSNQKLGSWLKDELKGLALGLALGVAAVEIIYWTIREWPNAWWVIAWLVFIGFSIVLAQIAPVILFPLFYKFVPLEDEELKARLLRLSARAGTQVRGVFEWKLSEKSKKANAALAGLGSTRRIIVADTLLQNYSHDEIEAILAHELGHHVHRHIFKSILVQVVVTFVGFWAANEALRYAADELQWFQGLGDFANLPLLALVSTVLSFLLMPALNAYSRFNERQADLYCWKAVPSIAPFITSMNKLSSQNLAERQPSRLVEVLFHSHPPIAKRIAAAEAFARARN
jgi:STE24 endopeptidase